MASLYTYFLALSVLIKHRVSHIMYCMYLSKQIAFKSLRRIYTVQLRAVINFIVSLKTAWEKHLSGGFFVNSSKKSIFTEYQINLE